jgi:VCBS repeat-containing protein
VAGHWTVRPTLDAIADQAIDEDAGVQTVNLSGISAGGGESQALAVTATSSNTALIPDPTVSYTSPDATGSLAYAPVANQSGAATITVTVRDAGPDDILGNADDDTFSRTFIVNVTAVNDAPVAVADSSATDQDTPVTGNVLANDTDPDSGAVLTVSAVNGSAGSVGTPLTLSSGALLTVNADGSYSYDPNGAFRWLAQGQSATDSFSYQVSDEFGATSTATVTLTLTGQ